MERDENYKTCAVGTSDNIDSRCAVNSLILDYYKKFGRKRDLEQYFSLSTAQSDIKDTSGLFWRKMKSENDSSDSGGRRSDSSHEVCRISIKCSLPEPSSSQDDESKTKTESPKAESPPIIIEEVPVDVSRHTDDESMNFDDNNSQKSLDALLDLSAQKPHSPTSSITSQRKLEWDSLADVGYANESDRKTSASGLSTLERLALKQQYSNNDSKQDIGPPTSHSTPLEENDDKTKAKKGLGKKTTKIYKKDVDFVEVNVPHTSDTNQTPSINVNLTKHISFNVEKDGGITVDNIKRDLNISPEKITVDTKSIPYLRLDKEIQTSLTKDKSSSKEKSCSMDETNKNVNPYYQKIPVIIGLNTLRKRLRRKKSRVVRKKSKSKTKIEAKEIAAREKSGEQVSEAESFEYMPGHMYNQNQLKDNEPRPDNSTAGNKSSLESSGPVTTDSSKDSKHSLTKDLEKCVDLLKVTLQKRYDDGTTKKKLIKEIVRRLVNSKYRDDDTTTEFLSGLSNNFRKLGVKGNNTTTSTSDANNTEDCENIRPKKSILRNEKFNPNVVSSITQSAPNLCSGSAENLKTTLIRTINSHTESDASSREKTSSENAFPKTSSEELYLKYLEALRCEESYKRHLKDKEMFLKQKLVSSETAMKVPVRQEFKVSNRLKDLMKDLTRNNYDDGSGDASKLEGGSTSNFDFDRINAIRNERSHSVFTLSSSHSEIPKRPNLKKKMQAERDTKVGEAGPSKNHYCCCPHHHANKVDYADSSVQVNIKYQCEHAIGKEKPSQTKQKLGVTLPSDNIKKKLESPRKARVVPDNVTGEVKCVCNGNQVSSTNADDNFMIYACSRLLNRGIRLEEPTGSYNSGVQCGNTCSSLKDDKIELIQPPCKMNTETCSSDSTSNARNYSKSSQTNMLGSENNYSSGSEVKNLCGTSTRCILGSAHSKRPVSIPEATRCLQTKISIDPKISDPTFSDINIVSDCNCAKLIAEEFRKVSQSITEKSERRMTYTDVSTNSASEKLLFQPEESTFRDEMKPSKRTTDEAKEVRIGRTTIAAGNEYKVPIKGTNMTLTVNLGEVEVTRKSNQVNQAVGTEICIADEATSVNVECTKSAQCSCSCSVDHNSNKSYTEEVPISPKKPSSLKKYLTENFPKSNTYPKVDAVKEKPPFLRSNTDTVTLAICTCVQTDSMTKNIDAESNNNTKLLICGNQPIPKVITCENACQVDKVEESNKLETEDLFDLEALRTDIKKNTNYSAFAVAQSDKKEHSVQNTKKHVGIQKDLPVDDPKILTVDQSKPVNESIPVGIETSKTSTKSVSVETEPVTKTDVSNGVACQTSVQEEETIQKSVAPTSSSYSGPKDARGNAQEELCSPKECPDDVTKNPVIDMIQDITRRYSKTDTGKIKKKKCFTEIMTVLNYLLETDDCTNPEPKICCSTSSDSKSSKSKKHECSCCSNRQVDKGVKQSCRKSRKDNKVCTESSDVPCSSDLPTTSTDSAACRVLNKIKKECEKYHQRKCKGGKKCEISSSTSVNCEKCKKVHHCACRHHKCKRSKTFEKIQKKCIAYNLIIETSESMVSEEPVCDKKCRPLQNIILKVPNRKDNAKKEAKYKTEHESPRCSPRCGRNRSKSCPNESETSDEYARRIELATVREYLERNRPDFVESTSQRQNCLKYINERSSNERAAHRNLLSLHVEQQPDLTNLSSDELQQLARQIGLGMRRKKTATKFISEREMKKHSEDIYKTLPEVVKKKEEKKKENAKKTNLLMAKIFQKSLQKQALRGSVNLSSYNSVIRI